MTSPEYKYWAFISYSHRDSRAAAWLHRRLETYRVPRRLVGRAGADGPLPRRLFPVFRDAEEFPSSPNLSQSIEQALRASRYLIVIASPYAAASRWVDEEIRLFRALGRGDRVLALIVDGEPNASDRPGSGQLECFPPALLEPVAGARAEPIAADLRPGMDGRTLAAHKLLAGVLGVGLDELRRRERQRQRWTRIGWSAAVLALAVVLGAGWRALHAQKQRELVAQALHTRIGALYESGRKELLADNQARAAVLLGEAYRLGLDTPSLRFMLGRAMRIVDSAKLRFLSGAPVRELRFSPDGTRLLTRGSDDQVRLWDARSGAALGAFALDPAVYPGNPRFSGDGSRLVATRRDEAQGIDRVQVRDTATLAVLADLDAAEVNNRPFALFNEDASRIVLIAPDRSVVVHDLAHQRVALKLPGRFREAGYSRDRRLLVTGDDAGEVRSWNAATGAPLQRFSGLGASIVSLDTSPDGSQLAAGAADGGVRLWDMASARLLLSAGHATGLKGLVFNIDGSRLLTATFDSARVWDTHNSALLHALKFPNSESVIHISADGRWVINTGSSRLGVVDVQSGTELFTLDGHPGVPTALDFSDHGNLIATGGRDGSVVIWDAPAVPAAEFRHGSGRADPANPASPPLAAVGAFSADNRQLFTSGLDGRVGIDDLASGSTPLSLNLNAAVSAGAFSPDGSRLALGGFGRLQLVDVAAPHRTVSLPGVDTQALLLRFSADGRTLAGAILGGVTRLWDVASGRQIASYVRDEALAAAFSPTQRRFAYGAQGELRMTDLDSGAQLWQVRLEDADNGDIAAVDFSADGRRLGVATYSGRLFALAADDGRELARAQEPSAAGVITARISADGGTLLVGDSNRCALIWHIADGALRSLCGHGEEVRVVQASADGALLLTASGDGTAKLWDAASGALLDTVAVHGGEIAYNGAQLGADQRSLLTASADGSVRLWNIAPETRSAEEVARRLACRVPWRLNGETLTAAAPAAEACSAAASSAAALH